MRATSARYTWRLLLAGLALVGLLACGDTSCDCATPLEGPLPDEALIADALQVRLTPAGFGFLEAALPALLPTLLGEGGLAFEVSPSQQVIDAWLFTLVIDICPAGCSLQADIADAALARVEPDRLQLTGHLNLGGMVFLTGDVECDVPIHVQQKPIAGDIQLAIDARDGLLTFDVTGVSISLTDEDYSLDCRGLLGPLIESLKPVLTDQINQEIGGQLDSALAEMLTGATCLPCDFYTGGCPVDSDCADAVCSDAESCRTQPLGMAGRIDLGELLADVVPGLQAPLDVLLAVGQELPPAEDPVVVSDGLELRLLGGALAEPHGCAPVPAPEDIPLPAAAPRFAFPVDDLVPGTDVGFMAGIALADVFLDWAVYQAWRGGALCLTLDSQTTELLSTGTLSALLGSLDALTAGRNAPVRLRLRPQGVPSARIGLGTFTVDGSGNTVIDDPLLTILLPNTALDFYAVLDDRWTKLVTLTQDMALRIGLEFLPDNRVLPVFDEYSIALGETTASGYELLAEDPAVLAGLLPTLLGLALPMLTESLGVIELPEIEGFALDLLRVEGEQPLADDAGYEFLALYANLALAAAPPPAPPGARARLVELRVPDRGRMSIFAPGGPSLPELVVEVGAAAPAEYSWRLDGRGWSVFRPGPRLIVRHPLLALTGEHTLEVRARRPGAYRSLDPEPVRLTFAVSPADGVRFDPPLPRAARELLGLQQARSTPLAEAAAEPHVGCATAPGSGALGALLLALLALGRRRRR